VKSEAWLPVAIFAALVLLIATPLLIHQIRDVRRPELLEARIVMASGADTTYRDGPLRVGPGEQVSIAVALRIAQAGGRERWLAPVARLELDGSPVDHQQVVSWPERDRQVRVFWFTVECSNVGGLVTPDRASRLLRYRTFLASEMGRDLMAARLPEAHNDDALGPEPDRLPVDAGTIRLYARVEVFDPERDVRATQSASTAGREQILDPGYPALSRSARFADGVNPAVGELFLLSGWEVEGDDEALWDEVGMAAFGLPFADLVERRIAVSSRTFAAVATSGKPRLADSDLEPGVTVTVVDGTATAAGRALRWSDHLRPGDLLMDGSHFTVLVADDGDGILNVSDTVAHCWRRPPALTTLGAVLPEPSRRLRLTRHVR
jgi:hypothetical protein